MANGARHTMGKWAMELVGSGGSYDNPTDVYEVNNGYTRICEHCTEEDARLIAAAPELLAALERAVQYFDDNGGEREYTWLPQMKAALKSAGN